MTSHVSLRHVPWSQEVALETIQANADLREPLLPLLLALQDTFGYVDRVRSARRAGTQPLARQLQAALTFYSDLRSTLEQPTPRAVPTCPVRPARRCLQRTLASAQTALVG